MDDFVCAHTKYLSECSMTKIMEFHSNVFAYCYDMVKHVKFVLLAKYWSNDLLELVKIGRNSSKKVLGHCIFLNPF